ncbi:MAG: class I SAM-dependent methyltransferase [Porticoccaceae bacterium]
MTDLFAEKSADFDLNPFVTRLSAAISDAMVDSLTLDATMNVLDFGAGTGLISAKLAPLVSRIVAVDISPAMLAKLAAKPDLNGKVTTRCQDLLTAPLAETFDVVVSAMAMHHIEDTRQLIHTLAAHLKPGGQIALADLDSEDGSFHPADTAGVFHHGFDRDNLRRLIENAGFSDIHFTTAHNAERENGVFPIFLVTARKKQST